MPRTDDTPLTRAAAHLTEAMQRVALTPAQLEIVKATAREAMNPSDLFAQTRREAITARLEEVEMLIADSLARGQQARMADLKARALAQQELAVHDRRREMLAARRALYPECWCFGRGGRGETAIVAFHPDHTVTGWDGAVRRMPLSAPLALAQAGIPEQTCREICPHCPEGRAMQAAKDRGEEIIRLDFERRSLERRWTRTGIPERVRQFDLDAYPDGRKIARIEAWYRGEIIPGVQREYRAALMLSGENQRGKSTIGYLLAARAFDAGRGVICRTVPDLYGELRSTFDADTRQNGALDQPKAATHEELLDDLKTVWLLMLDDLGAENQSRYTDQTFFQILEARLQAGDAVRTIVTTNLKAEKLADRYKDRNWSRVSGMFCRVWINWEIMGPAAEGLLDLDADLDTPDDDEDREAP